MVAVMSFHAEKCCHLVSVHEASAHSICSSVLKFLIHSTFVLVVIIYKHDVLLRDDISVDVHQLCV